VNLFRHFLKQITFAFLLFPAILAIVLTPRSALACACGCGIFDVGVSSGMLMPQDTDSGFSVWVRYSYMDQNKNWEGSSSAPSTDNFDKEIKTSFITFGGQYMINRDWTVMAELPTFDRSLKTTDDGTVYGPSGSVYTGRLYDMGDMMVQGMYTGFSSDLSTGISFGLKLPTGNYTGPNGPLGGSEFDRDSLPGTGSTDLLIGAYHVGSLTGNQRLNYFVQALYHFAVITRNDYRPGNELDGALGLTYSFFNVGFLSRLSPVVQLLGSNRSSDSQYNADPLNSGYTRLIVAPGLELRFAHLRLFADVEFPIYQYTNAADGLAAEGTSGQLVAPVAYKAQLAYDF
jgi:hypothetical protein